MKLQAEKYIEVEFFVCFLVSQGKRKNIFCKRFPFLCVTVAISFVYALRLRESFKYHKLKKKGKEKNELNYTAWLDKSNLQAVSTYIILFIYSWSRIH